jgi:hypothetical protein
MGHRIGRLLDERQHPAAVVGRDTAERPGVGDLDQVERDIGTGLVVQLVLATQVVPAEDVTVEDHHRVVRPRLEAVGHVPDRPARAQRLLLRHEREPHSPSAAVPEHRRELVRLVARRQHDVPGASRRQLGDLVHDERHARDRQQVLRRVRGERQHPAAQPARDDDRFHGAIQPSAAAGPDDRPHLGLVT